jgi:hypothetical protein
MQGVTLDSYVAVVAVNHHAKRHHHLTHYLPSTLLGPFIAHLQDESQQTYLALRVQPLEQALAPSVNARCVIIDIDGNNTVGVLGDAREIYWYIYLPLVCDEGTQLTSCFFDDSSP